jgi:hypothetical protein
VPVALAGLAIGATRQPGYLLPGLVAEGARDLVLTGIAAVQVDQRGPGGGVPHAVHQLAQRGPSSRGKHIAGVAEVMKMQVRQTDLAGGLNPYAATEQAVPQQLAGRAGENQRVTAGLSEVTQVPADDRNDQVR